MTRDIPRAIAELSARVFTVWRAVGDSPHHLTFATDDGPVHRARVMNTVDQGDCVKIYPEDVPEPDYMLFVWEGHLYVVNGNRSDHQSVNFSISDPSDLNEYSRQKANLIRDFHIDTVESELTDRENGDELDE